MEGEEHQTSRLHHVLSNPCLSSGAHMLLARASAHRDSSDDQSSLHGGGGAPRTAPGGARPRSALPTSLKWTGVSVLTKRSHADSGSVNDQGSSFSDAGNESGDEGQGDEVGTRPLQSRRLDHAQCGRQKQHIVQHDRSNPLLAHVRDRSQDGDSRSRDGGDRSQEGHESTDGPLDHPPRSQERSVSASPVAPERCSSQEHAAEALKRRCLRCHVAVDPEKPGRCTMPHPEETVTQMYATQVKDGRAEFHCSRCGTTWEEEGTNYSVRCVTYGCYTGPHEFDDRAVVENEGWFGQGPRSRTVRSPVQKALAARNPVPHGSFSLMDSLQKHHPQ